MKYFVSDNTYSTTSDRKHCDTINFISSSLFPYFEKNTIGSRK